MRHWHGMPGGNPGGEGVYGDWGDQGHWPVVSVRGAGGGVVGGGVASGRADSSAACVARVGSTSCRAVNCPATWPCLSSRRCWRCAGARAQRDTAPTNSLPRPATIVIRAASATPRQPCRTLTIASGAPVDTAGAREETLIGTTHRRRRDVWAWNALPYGTWVPPRARGRTEGQAGSGGFFPRSEQDSSTGFL